MGKLFNLISGDKSKKHGPTKKQVEIDRKMGFAFFFKLLKNRFGNITITSILFSICNFPVLLFLLGISGNFDTYVSTPASPLYAQVYGLQMAGAKGPFISALQTIFGNSASIQVYSTASSILRYSGLLFLLTLGITTIGLCYNLREVVRCEPLSPFSDFFTAIKKNFKQGIVLTLMDAALVFFFYYDIVIYYANMKTGSFFMQMAFYLIVIVTILYFQFRYYAYTIMMTFDMKFRTIFKNSLYLLFLGWKRNVVSIIGSAALIFMSVYLFLLMPSVGILFPVIFGLGLLGYIGMYCSFPIIDRYIIQPYYEEHPDEDPSGHLDNVESIFTDRG